MGLLLKPSMITGLVLGGAIMMANFHLLGKIVERALTPERKASAGLIVAFVLKFAFLFGSIALLVMVFKIHPVALAVGASTLVLAILYDALLPAAEI